MTIEERAANLHKRLEMCLCSHPYEDGNTYRGILIEALRDERNAALDQIIEFAAARTAFHRSKNSFKEGDVLDEMQKITLLRITEARVIESHARALKDEHPQDEQKDAENGR